jgi:hypothetical protein
MMGTPRRVMTDDKSRFVHVGLALAAMLSADAALVHRASLRIVANGHRWRNRVSKAKRNGHPPT